MPASIAGTACLRCCRGGAWVHSEHNPPLPEPGDLHHERPDPITREKFAELLALTREPFPASRKAYIPGQLHADLRVPVRATLP